MLKQTPEQEDSNSKARKMVIGYPFALIFIGMVVNWLAFGFDPISVAMPDKLSIIGIIIAAVLLLANHTWLMTSTELTRIDHGLLTTPEEWAEKNREKADAAQAGWDALERRHNAHRNTTENTVYFAILAGLTLLVSPPAYLVLVWSVCFGVSRLAYTYSYFAANTDLRGIFMSLTLLPLYAMAGYLFVAMMMSF
ncbi:MAPEG family protein [Lentilitoribacter sp. Alg239-R112]|uniref:MAPEG family protein n=1 Tax=Lentilitoribacter sp. Alg239-R112 TaxID=2305987 RepID=UPI0013A6AC11|nr:MAPEG family protein [Lentilitoribacter sp. Alg239-R112]